MSVGFCLRLRVRPPVSGRPLCAVRACVGSTAAIGVQRPSVHIADQSAMRLATQWAVKQRAIVRDAISRLRPASSHFRSSEYGFDKAKQPDERKFNDIEESPCDTYATRISQHSKLKPGKYASISLCCLKVATSHHQRPTVLRVRWRTLDINRRLRSVTP